MQVPLPHPASRAVSYLVLRLVIVTLLLSQFAVTLSADERPPERYPKPEPATKFAEMKLYDAKGSPWRAAREDWEGARRQVVENANWAKWLASERAEIDRWMARHRDHVEWIAGWSHDGISPKDGSRIRWTDKIPGEDVHTFSTPSDPEIEITEKLKAWWVVTFRGRHNQMMNRAASLYRLTGETRYADWAASQLDFYADNYLQWKPVREDQGARLYWQTLTEATNLIIYVDTARLLGDYITPTRKEHWRTAFFAPEVEVIDATYQSVHNIGTWQRCAAAQVALLYGDEAMWNEALDGTWGLRRQMAEGITSDYIWHEQSLGYNSYVVRAVLTLFKAASLHGRADKLGYEMTVSENLMLSTTYMRFPDGYLPNPADNGGRLTAPEVAVFAESYRIFPTKLGLAAAANDYNWDTLLDPPSSIAAERKFDIAAANHSAITLPQVTTHNLESSRMAILRLGAWQVYFHYGQLVRSHTQSEALNYEVYYNDTDISHDNGTVGYGSPLYRGYYTRGANHNTPLIDGEGEDLEPMNDSDKWPVENGMAQSPLLGELIGYASDAVLFASKPNMAFIGARQKQYRTNASVTRGLAIFPGNTFIDSVIVETTDGKNHQLGFPLHVQGKVQLPGEFKPVDNFSAGRPEPFSYWRDPRVAEYEDVASFVVEYPNKQLMKIVLQAPGKTFRIYHSNSPDVPPDRRETLYLELEDKSANIITEFIPITE